MQKDDDGNPYASPREILEEPAQPPKPLPLIVYILHVIFMLPLLGMDVFCVDAALRNESGSDFNLSEFLFLFSLAAFVATFIGLCFGKSWAYWGSAIITAYWTVLMLYLDFLFVREPPRDFDTGETDWMMLFLVFTLTCYLALVSMSCFYFALRRQPRFEPTPFVSLDTY